MPEAIGYTTISIVMEEEAIPPEEEVVFPAPKFVAEGCYVEYNGTRIYAGQTLEVLKGKTVRVYARVSNQGGPGTIDVRVWDLLSESDRAVLWKETTMDSGQTLDLYLGSITVNADMQLELEAWYWNEDKGAWEFSDETDEFYIKVKAPTTPPTFTIADIIVSPESPTEDDDVSVFTIFDNTGDVSGDVTVLIELDGDVVYQKIMSVQAHDSADVTRSLGTLTKGDHNICVELIPEREGVGDRKCVTITVEAVEEVTPPEEEIPTEEEAAPPTIYDKIAEFLGITPEQAKYLLIGLAALLVIAFIMSLFR